VIVRRIEAEEKTKGGIIIPDGEGETAEGEVIAAGPGTSPRPRAPGCKIIAAVTRGRRALDSIP